MVVTVVIGGLSALLMFISAFFFYMYGEEFFIENAPVTWKIISLGFIIIGLGFLGYFLFTSLLDTGLYLVFSTLNFIGAIVILTGFAKGFYDSKEGKY